MEVDTDRYSAERLSSEGAPSEDSLSAEYLSVSTSNKKCIPPAKSKPRLIGFPPIELSHSGVEGSEFKAIMNSPSE